MINEARGEPAKADFDGTIWRRYILRWVLATRPKFLTASVLPVGVGTAWGARQSDTFDGTVFALALLATVLVHAAANVFNDVGDALSGADAGNTERIFPYTGGSRFIQNGIMSTREMLALSAVLLVAAVVLGSLLTALKGPVVVWLGMLGIALGLCYSLPLVQISGRGIGEAAVAVAFGVLPVTGAAWLQNGSSGSVVAWLSLPVGLWVAAILLINEIPDRGADAAAGKRTLVVRLGQRRARALYATLHAGAAVSVILGALLGAVPIIVSVGPLVLAAFGVMVARNICDDRDTMRRGIESTLMIHAIGCVWLIATSLLA